MIFLICCIFLPSYADRSNVHWKGGWGEYVLESLHEQGSHFFLHTRTGAVCIALISSYCSLHFWLNILRHISRITGNRATRLEDWSQCWEDCSCDLYGYLVTLISQVSWRRDSVYQYSQISGGHSRQKI